MAMRVVVERMSSVLTSWGAFDNCRGGTSVSVDDSVLGLSGSALSVGETETKGDGGKERQDGVVGVEMGKVDADIVKDGVADHLDWAEEIENVELAGEGSSDSSKI